MRRSCSVGTGPLGQSGPSSTIYLPACFNRIGFVPWKLLRTFAGLCVLWW